ncbi:MAG: hydrolase [Caulobacteraceae bacterium]|nr:hydrolase [Caulobacteraceae bacterium]
MIKDRVIQAEAGPLAKLSAEGEAMVEAVIAWSRINSGSANLAGLEAMADALTPALTALGGVLERLEPAPVETIDAEGRPSPLRRGRNLRLTVRPKAPVQVLLTGHMDTVFPQTDAFQEPRWTRLGVLNGPGVADMKGGLVVMLGALGALERSPWAERLGYQVVINSDEEVSSLGSAPLLLDSAAKAQVGLVFEPATGPDGTLAGARKGLAAYTLVARGVCAHAGRDHASGRNAIVAAADFAVRAASLSGMREGLTINIGRIDGGGATNVVPDLALCRFEARVATHADRHWVEGELQRIAQQTGALHDLTLDLHGRFTRPPKPFDASTRALFEAVAACGADLGQAIGWKATGGCCDGNNLAETGLPVVDTLGVRGGAIHSREEFLIADSLVERAQLSALLLMRLASGAIPVPPRARSVP